MYKVMIVEDDLMVCSILEKQLGRFPRLSVTGKFKRGTDALKLLKDEPDATDLIILDYYMPGMNGVEFLKEIRKTNTEVQVIMITSADEYSIIRSAMCCGICDYVLKPFNAQRLEKAISKFETVMKLKKITHVWTQEKVDTLLCPHKHYNTDQSGDTAIQKAGKINKTTLEAVRDYMRYHTGEKMPLSEISEGIALSTVTTRRYLKYMNSLGEIQITHDCKTGGRPSEIFEYNGEVK